MATADNLIVRVNPVMPAPTLTAGRPDPSTFVPTTYPVPEVDWGDLVVKIGPHGGTQTDATFIRGVPCVVESMSSADPFGESTARIRFPQYTPFDAYGSGDWSFLGEFHDVTIYRRPPGGTPLTALWEGFVPVFSVSQVEDGAGLTIDCTGCLLQLKLYVRTPGLSDSADALDDVFDVQFDSVTAKPALHTEPLVVTGGPTGLTTRYKGGGENDLEFVAGELAKATTVGGDQWTILNQGSRTPELVLRDKTTVAATYTVGTPGVVLDLQQNWEDAENVIYGEAQDEAGSLLRNIFIGADGGARYQPWAFSTAVHAWDLDETTGALDTAAFTIDPTVARVERYFHFGTDLNRDEILSISQQYLDRDSDPGWSGRITLTVDPEEAMSRLELKAGQNIKLKYWAGSGATGTVFHIAGCDHRLQGDKYVATLTVDTKARDLYALEEIIRRIKSGNSPTRQLRAGRQSGIIADKSVPWDGKQSGYYPASRAWPSGAQTVSLTAGTWNTQRIMMAGGPLTVVKSEFHASVAAQFGVYVFDWNITSADLPTNPFADGAWDTPPDGFIVGWGTFGQHAGYWPGLESDGDAVTGVLIDETSWDIPPRRGTAASNDGDVNNASLPPYLYVAIYAASTCTMWGRFYHGG
jgi:hypothetical protein